MAAVYALGSNGSGQLGIDHREDVSVPKEVLFKDQRPEEIAQIRAGGNHTLLLSNTGKLFCSGISESGACGLQDGPQSTTFQFRQVRLHKKYPLVSSSIVLFATTWDASVIVLKDENGKGNKVYSFGTGEKGELGLGEFMVKASEPQLIPDFPPGDTEVVDLAASVSHVVAVLSNGHVYGWGNGRKAQLGSPGEIIKSPRRITQPELNFMAVRAICGREFTYVLGESGTGDHVLLGSDKWGAKSSAPKGAPEWKDVGASWSNIFILKNDGSLLSWGRDDHGQLPPPNLPRLSQIAIGSEHVLGLTADNEVLAWGWGEHGNCGPSTVEGDGKGTWNTIASSKYLPSGWRIVSIGAGCATSWICTIPMS